MNKDGRSSRRMLDVGVPEYRDHVDCAGVMHRFRHMPRKITKGAWSLTAVEIDPPLAPGYQIHSKVSSSIYTAYLDLLNKIEDAMASKHLIWSNDDPPDLLTGTLQGRIADGGLVVDGQRLSFETLERLLSTHEGFPIKITIGRWTD